MTTKSDARRTCQSGNVRIIEDQKRASRNRLRPRRQVIRVLTADGRKQGVLIRGSRGWLAFFQSVGGLILTGGHYRTRAAAVAAVRSLAGV